jgi:ATP-dependent helicase YprA (DUF1998 family)
MNTNTQKGVMALRNSVRIAVWTSVERPTWNSLRPSIWTPVGNSLENSVLDLFKILVRNSVRNLVEKINFKNDY